MAEEFHHAVNARPTVPPRRSRGDDQGKVRNAGTGGGRVCREASRGLREFDKVPYFKVNQKSSKSVDGIQKYEYGAK